METVELIEEYDSNGVCVKRSINGHELPADTEPSIQIFKNVSSVTQKFYLTKEEVKQRWGDLSKLVTNESK